MNLRFLKAAALTLSGLSLLALGTAREAKADPANPVLVDILAEGDLYRWVYRLDLTDTELVTTGDYFTIYDFEGFAGGLSGPADWTASTALVGPVPPAVSVTEDNAGVPNITFTYDGAAPIGPGGSIFDFSALSEYNQIAIGEFTSRTTRTPTTLGKISSVGPVQRPTIPEPSSLALLGMSAVGVMAVARRRKAAKSA